MFGIGGRAQWLRSKNFCALLGELSELGHMFGEHQVRPLNHQELIADVESFPVAGYPDNPLVINRKNCLTIK